MLLSGLILGNILLSRVAACGDEGHKHVPRQIHPVITPPTTPLVWGDINFLHTTDSHGWLGGHTKPAAPEPNYSGDLGKFASFVSHMKAEAERRDVDLLLIDSGDLHDGNGLTDGFPPGDVNGHEALKLFAQLPYDLLAIGNHELYKYEVAHDIHKNFAPRWNGRYLTSNANITIQDEYGRTVSVPIGARYAKFKTQRGRSITALGVIFHFTMNSANTTVQSGADMAKEPWFKEVIAEEPDAFILVGHMPVRGYQWPAIFDAIRAVHPYTPIFIFGGHNHVRDCIQLDGRSMSLVSGRYMETIGAELGERGSTEDILFNRRYLDANPVTYSFHTGKLGLDFDTFQGQIITAGVQALSERFNLSYQFGVAPQDYFASRAPFPSDRSLLSLYASEVIPTALTEGNPRASIPKIFVTNSGALRYDLYAGPFTRNDQFIVSPFTNKFEYISNISSSVANRIVDELNDSGLPAMQKREAEAQYLVKADNVAGMYQLWMKGQWEKWNMEQRDPTDLTFGYVTDDACPGVGDDVPHRVLPHYDLPPFIGSPPPSVSPDSDDSIDLIFADFIHDSVLLIVNTLNQGSKPNVTDADVKPYSDLLTDQVFGAYAHAAWN